MAVCGGCVIRRTNRRRWRLTRYADRPTGLLGGRNDAAPRFLLRFSLRRRRLARLAAGLLNGRGGTTTGHRPPFEHAASGLLDRRRRRFSQVRSDLSLKPHHHLVAGREPAIFHAASKDVALLRAGPPRSGAIFGSLGDARFWKVGSRRQSDALGERAATETLASGNGELVMGAVRRNAGARSCGQIVQEPDWRRWNARTLAKRVWRGAV